MSHKSYSRSWLSNNWHKLKERKASNNHRNGNFSIHISTKTICTFVITSMGLFYLSVWKLIYSRVTKFSCEQTVIEHCQSYFVLFARGVNPFHLPCYDLWWIQYWKLIMKADTANNLNRNVSYLTRVTIRNCRHFSLFLFLSQSGF